MFSAITVRMPKRLDVSPSWVWAVILCCAIAALPGVMMTAVAAPSAESVSHTKEASLSAHFLQAIRRNDHEMLQTLLAEGVRLDVPLAGGGYPIIEAVRHGDIGLLKLLTARDTPIYVTDEYGLSPLHIAIEQQDVLKIKLLLSFSPKLASLRTPTGITPLYQAYDLAALDIADILITHGGADINATGKNGDLLAFWLVSESDDAEVAAHLVNHQLDLFKRNAKDQTLIEVAYEAGNKVMAAQLGKAYEAILQQYEKKLQAQHENNATKGKQSR